LGTHVLEEKQVSRSPEADDIRGGAVVKRRVLVAEDNSFLSEIMQKELEALKYEVTVASNGFEAVKMAASQMPDFIIMDLTMPELDGFEAASQIRRNPKTKAIPLLAVTALMAPEIRKRCLASGFDGCIIKPFTAWELDAAIKDTFKGPNGHC
jgi:CheY-like chemotaxis protein